MSHTGAGGQRTSNQAALESLKPAGAHVTKVSFTMLAGTWHRSRNQALEVRGSQT